MIKKYQTNFKKYGKAKVITATNVFAHIDNINSILKLIKNLKMTVFLSVSPTIY